MPTVVIAPIAQYRAEYLRLAAALEKPGAEPAPGEVAFLTGTKRWREIDRLPAR